MKKTYNDAKDALKDILGTVVVKTAVFSNMSVTQTLDANRNVAIRLISRKTHNHFDALKVEIIHKENGKIEEAVFPFVDYIIPAWEHQNIKTTEHIWGDSNRFSWYGAEPTDKSVRTLREEISNWIKLWE
jgi:hypothetical protein